MRRTRTIGVQKYAGVGDDGHGNTTEVWADPVSALIWQFDPGSSTETVEGGDRTVTEPTIYAPGSLDVGRKDRVTVDGLTYDVLGDPHVWKRGDRVVGIVVDLHRAEG